MLTLTDIRRDEKEAFSDDSNDYIVQLAAANKSTTRRQLLSMIVKTVGATAIYHAIPTLGLASEWSFNEDMELKGVPSSFASAPLTLLPSNYTVPDSFVDSFVLVETPERLVINTPYRLDDKVVHPYIIECTGTIRGYRYIMVINPYTTSQEENPVIYGSNDLDNFEMLTGFIQPLDTPPVNGYLSDPGFAYDPVGGELVLYWRSTVNITSTKFESTYWYKRTKDLLNWTDKQQLCTEISRTTDDMLSPAILFDPRTGKWHIWNVRGTISSSQIRHRTADNLTGPWSESVSIPVMHTTPWHLEVRWVGDKFVMLIFSRAVRNHYLGISSDGINWKFSQNTLFARAVAYCYKSTFLPAFDAAGKLYLEVLHTGGSVAKRLRLNHIKSNAIDISVEPVNPDYSVLLDFNRDQYSYRNAGVLEIITLQQAITTTRSTTASYKDTNNFTKLAAINEPRIHYMQDFAVKGLLLEGARKNLLANPDTPATQTITLPASSRMRGLVLSIEGTGSATISGGVKNLSSASATVNNPQGAELASTAATSVTVTVTGIVVRFQLELIDYKVSAGYASTFIPSDVVTRAEDEVVLSELLVAKLADAQTIICEFIEQARVVNEDKAIADMFKILDTSKPRAGLFVRRSGPYPNLGPRIQTVYSILPNSSSVDRVKDLPATIHRKVISGISFDKGGLNLIQSYNGTAEVLPGTGTHTDFNSMVLGGRQNPGAILTRVLIYNYKMSEAELVLATSL